MKFLRVFVLVLSIVLPAHAFAAPSFDAVGSATAAYDNGAAVSPVTFTHTNTGATVMFVYLYANGGDYTTWACTYGPGLTPMTRISGTQPTYASAVFALKSPATGANTVSCTHDNVGSTIGANSISFTGSDTTGTGWGTFAVGVLNALGHPTGSVVSTAGDLVVGFLYARSFISGSPDGGGTQRFLNNGSSRIGGYHIAGANPTAIGWTVDSGDDAYVMGVSIPAAAGGAVVPKTMMLLGVGQ